MKREVVLEDLILHSNDRTVLEQIHVFCKSTFGRDGENTDPYEGSWLRYQLDLADLSRSQREEVWKYCEMNQIEVGDA